MQFLLRAFSGLLMIAVSLGALAVGGRGYIGCIAPLSGVPGVSCVFDQGDAAARRADEEVAAVRVFRAEPITATPVITAYGEARAARTLEVRAPAAGALSALAPGFREGGRIDVGALILEVDPREAENARADSAAALEEARSEKAAAAEAAELASAELAAAERLRDLRAEALERQQRLEGRGVTAQSAVETAAISLADAERAVIAAARSLAAERRRGEVAGLAEARAVIALADAERTLSETRLIAPFAGVVADVGATLGRRVTRDELLGALIDLKSLEAAFRVTDAEFARLLTPTGALAERRVAARVSLGPRAVTVTGVLDRVGPRVALSEGGRLVFARLALSPEAESVIRPGDFLTVEIFEPPLAGVVSAPVGAVGPEQDVLVLGEDRRLAAIPVSIVRRQGDRLLIRAAEGARPLAGLRILEERGPRLGPGVLARDAAAGPAGPRGEGRPRDGRRGDGGRGEGRRGDGRSGGGEDGQRRRDGGPRAAAPAETAAPPAETAAPLRPQVARAAGADPAAPEAQ